jgi:hypothetical protein
VVCECRRVVAVAVGCIRDTATHPVAVAARCSPASLIVKTSRCTCWAPKLRVLVHDSCSVQTHTRFVQQQSIVSSIQVVSPC